jgi:hypothetical protein
MVTSEGLARSKHPRTRRRRARARPRSTPPSGLHADDTLVLQTHPVTAEADQIAVRQTPTAADTVEFAVVGPADRAVG